MHEPNIQEMTPRDYIKVLFYQKFVILATIITVVVTAVLAVMLKTPEFEAQVKMLISGQKQTQAEYYRDIALGGLRGEQITHTQSEIVTSDPVLERAVSVLGLAKKPLDYEVRFATKLKRPIVRYFARNMEKKLGKLTDEQRQAYQFRMAVEDLRQKLKVVPVRETDLFLIKVRDYNPLGAAVTANVVSRSYTIFDLEQQLAEMQLKYGEKHLAVIQLKEAIDKISKSLSGERLSPLSAIGPATVKIIEQAKVPLKPVGIPKTLTVILAVFMSVFLSVMIAFTFEGMDQTFRSPQDAQNYLKLEHLGSLPKRVKESHYREVCQQLYLGMKNKDLKTLLLTSIGPHEGVTPIVGHLGVYVAQQLNKKVLLIDGNLRAPVMHRLFKLPDVQPAVNILDEKFTLAQGVREVGENIDLLTLSLTGGYRPGLWKKFLGFFQRRKQSPLMKIDPIAILESPRLKAIIKEAKDVYEYILIEGAALREFKDPSVLAGFAQGVVVVISERKTRRHVVKYAVEPLHKRNIDLLGFILNKRSYVIPKAIYDRV